jgi:hypothetical protein
VIRGRVLTSDGRPLRRVQVVLRGAGANERIVGTGLEGEYEITDLPAGRFTLIARRGGYLQSDYGQRRYGEPGKPLEVTADATVEGIDFTMERAAVISGRLSDEGGEPVANASMWAREQPTRCASRSRQGKKLNRRTSPWSLRQLPRSQERRRALTALPWPVAAWA